MAPSPISSHLSNHYAASCWRQAEDFAKLVEIHGHAVATLDADGFHLRQDFGYFPL